MDYFFWLSSGIRLPSAVKVTRCGDGYVLEGSTILNISGIDYPLREGDSMSQFSPSHQLSNQGTATFKSVWSISPPHVDYLHTGEKEKKSD